MTTTALPKTISPCPISEAIVEIRYETNVPSEAVLGMIYNRFQKEYPKTEKQPILQIPEAIRTSDPKLKFLPEYKLIGGNFLLQLGQRSFSIANVNEYAGWESFSARIFDAFRAVQSLEIVDTVTRLGLRYINTFDFDILPHSTLKLSHDDHALESTQSQVLATIPAGKFSNTLRVANNTEIRGNNRTFVGSVIDIDTSLEASIAGFFTKMEPIVEQAHLEEKKLFFSLLAKDYVSTLNPQYT